MLLLFFQLLVYIYYLNCFIVVQVDYYEGLVLVSNSTTFDRSGSPSISDIEAFSTAYRAQLDEAEVAKTIPENIYLEVLVFCFLHWKNVPFFF